MYEFCSERLKKILKVPRDKHADEILNGKTGGGKKRRARGSDKGVMGLMEGLIARCQAHLEGQLSRGNSVALDEGNRG